MLFVVVSADIIIGFWDDSNENIHHDDCDKHEYPEVYPDKLFIILMALPET